MTTSSSVSLMWSPPPLVDQNGIIVNYSLILRDLQYSANDITSISSTNNHIFTSLNEFNNYSCQVAAATIIGFGPYSEPKMLMTRQAGRNFSVLNFYNALF